MIGRTNLEQLITRAQRVLRVRPSGVITDFDGTLSPIVDHPDRAFPLPVAIEALGLLVRRLDLVAVVSGRAATDVARRLGIPGVVVIGNHGAERLRDSSVELNPVVTAWLESMGAVANQLEALLPSVLVEHKGITVSVHLRGIADARLRATIQDTVQHLASRFGLAVNVGREVLELRPPVAVNKGTAVRTLVEERELRGVVFAGDDTTDLDAMLELRALRADGRLSALLIGVYSPEAPTELAVTADELVEGVETFCLFLRELSAVLS